MKKLWSTIRHYSLFSIAFLALIISLGLAFAGYWTIAHYVLGIVSICLTLPIIWDMGRQFKTGTYGIDVLAVTTIITAVVLRQYWAAIVIVLMLSGGQALEDYAERRATGELHDLLTRVPKFAHIYRGRKLIDVPASEVQIGTRLVIRPGETVPVDAVVMEGSVSLDESSLTGESLPQIKRVGDIILSGSINIDSPITAKAIHSAKDSQYEQIIRLVRSASNSRAPFVRLADKYSIPFTLVSLAIAGAAWAISGQSIRFLEVLVVATPCPLILAAPIAVISGMSRSAKRGIIVKTGGTLERLASAKTFAFDKTGTLTRGQPSVDQVKAFGKNKISDVLSIAAGIEQNSNHVLAQAVVLAASAKKLRTAKIKKVKELPGLGLSGVAGRRKVLVGRLGLMDSYDLEVPDSFKAGQLKQTTALVAIDDKLIGIITFKDELRPETKPTLKRLAQMGIKNFMMLTGDNLSTANSVAKETNIKHVVAGVLPGGKITAIEKLSKDRRPVAFVGDGVNDAPVLTTSDVGIALGARGSTAASESADMVIMLDDLSQVAVGLEIAKRTFFIAKQSILIGIGLSIILMLVFATGRFRPLYGAIIQEIVDILVIFNALRAHGEGKTLKTTA